MPQITIAAKTMEGLDATDPSLTVTITELTGLEQTVSRTVIPDFNGSVTLNIGPPEGFPTWSVAVAFSLYDAGLDSAFVFQPSGQPNITHTFALSRLPNRWRPNFTRLASLAAPRFSPFKTVVAVSDNVDLKVGEIIGDLNSNYDTLASQAAILAKTALLNLFTVLTDEVDPVALLEQPQRSVPWFSYVRRIVRLDQERFLAEVDPALFENVSIILAKLGSTFGAQGYFTESPSLHLANIPPQYNAEDNLQQIITIKKDFEQGNLQLTVSFLIVNGVAVHLLDADLDEHRNIVLHGFDIIKHIFNGGTSPVDMHEYIVENSAQQEPGGISTVDLGYQLFPV
jgi:hypothetical protein